MTRILLDESVFANATLAINDGMLWIECEEKDLSVAVEVADVRAEIQRRESANEPECCPVCVGVTGHKIGCPEMDKPR